MPCPGKGNARAGLSLAALRRQSGEAGEMYVWSVQGHRLLVQVDGCGRAAGALAMDSVELIAVKQFFYLLRRHHAPVRSIAAAASRKICISVAGLGERRRNDRKAEDQQHNETQQASHNSAFTLHQYVPRPGR